MADPDQMPQNKAIYQGLHYLQMTKRLFFSDKINHILLRKILWAEMGKSVRLVWVHILGAQGPVIQK